MKPEFIPEQNGVVSVNDNSDLKDAFAELNDDSTNGEGFTNIDLRTRLTASQIPALTGLSMLCDTGVYPKKYNKIGRHVKRLAVSLRGNGRKEMVSITKGVREQETAAGKSVIERNTQ